MRPAKARALVTNAWALQGALLYIYTTTTTSSFRNNLWQP